MKKQLVLVLALTFSPLIPVGAQDAVVAPPANIVTDGVLKIPASMAETVGRYTENRSANDADWHPERREMLITTRFGNTVQLHLVKMPGGARQQLTFFPEPVLVGRFHPNLRVRRTRRVVHHA